APHVRGRHPAGGRIVLHVRDHADRRADRGEGVQLGQHHVARRTHVRDANAVCRGFRDPLHHRRVLRADAGHRAG
nr:hypothetical protein [Tanacetum cinerariifolium]